MTGLPHGETPHHGHDARQPSSDAPVGLVHAPILGHPAARESGRQAAPVVDIGGHPPGPPDTTREADALTFTLPEVIEDMPVTQLAPIDPLPVPDVAEASLTQLGGLSAFAALTPLIDEKKRGPSSRS
jgi:hypothetical protein